MRIIRITPLGTCAVSGKELGSKGEAIVKTYDGREVRLCCAGCVGTFEKNLEDSWKNVDEAMIKDQMLYYPLETCLVTGEELSEGGSMEAINIVHGNRLVRLCCNMCKKKFSADPEKYIQELDRAVIEAQVGSSSSAAAAARTSSVPNRRSIFRLSIMLGKNRANTCQPSRHRRLVTNGCVVCELSRKHHSCIIHTHLVVSERKRMFSLVRFRKKGS